MARLTIIALLIGLAAGFWLGENHEQTTVHFQSSDAAGSARNNQGIFSDAGAGE